MPRFAPGEISAKCYWLATRFCMLNNDVEEPIRFRRRRTENHKYTDSTNGNCHSSYFPFSCDSWRLELVRLASVPLWY